jgi:hypothetical protein
LLQRQLYLTFLYRCEIIFVKGNRAIVFTVVRSSGFLHTVQSPITNVFYILKDPTAAVGRWINDMVIMSD